MSTETLREQFLAQAEAIAAVYRDTRPEISHDSRQRVQTAYTRLQELGAWIPDGPDGWLPWSDMPAGELARARRRAEDGWSSPQVTLALIHQVLDLRQQLAALGGSFGVTDDDIRSMLGEGFHTAWRKAVDSPEAVVIHRLIGTMDEDTWSAIIRFTASSLIRELRAAESRTTARDSEAAPAVSGEPS